MFVLHLFSGVRRQGDIQDCFDMCVSRFPAKLFILSIDVINDPINGDLTKVESVRLWIRLLKAGYIAAIVCGPPCET
eukprot:9500494-Pyramimonas_sp.AAC.1